MDIKERMKVLTTVQRYIKQEVQQLSMDHLRKSEKFSYKLGNARQLTCNFIIPFRLNELLDIAYSLSEELPDHEIEYDSLTGDSTREFYQDLAEFLVKEAEYLINRDIREAI
jgi:hypothetical protein